MDKGPWSMLPFLVLPGIRIRSLLNMQSLNELGLFLFVMLSATHYSYFFGIKKRRKKKHK